VPTQWRLTAAPGITVRQVRPHTDWLACVKVGVYWPSPRLHRHEGLISFTVGALAFSSSYLGRSVGCSVARVIFQPDVTPFPEARNCRSLRRRSFVNPARLECVRARARLFWTDTGWSLVNRARRQSETRYASAAVTRSRAPARARARACVPRASVCTSVPAPRRRHELD